MVQTRWILTVRIQVPAHRAQKAVHCVLGGNYQASFGGKLSLAKMQVIHSQGVQAFLTGLLLLLPLGCPVKVRTASLFFPFLVLMEPFKGFMQEHLQDSLAATSLASFYYSCCRSLSSLCSSLASSSFLLASSTSFMRFFSSIWIYNSCCNFNFFCCSSCKFWSSLLPKSVFYLMKLACDLSSLDYCDTPPREACYDYKI